MNMFVDFEQIATSVHLKELLLSVTLATFRNNHGFGCRKGRELSGCEALLTFAVNDENQLTIVAAGGQNARL